MSTLAHPSARRAPSRSVGRSARDDRSARPAGRAPGATYRLQLHAGFGFRAVRELLPRLQGLGVTDVYLSPILRARRGSPHGYDVTDPRRLNPDLGSPQEFDDLAAELRSRGMGLVLDVVPNHMALGAQNRWWMDVLENGPSSPHASTFDIDWYQDEVHGPKVLLPCLGRPYGEALEDGELQLDLAEEGFVVRYFEWTFPVDPSTWNVVLGQGLGGLRDRVGRDHPATRGVLRVMAAVRALPSRANAGPTEVAERLRGKGEILRTLSALRALPEVERHLAAAIARVNGRRGDPGSVDLLDRLLNQQAYRPAYWKVATETVEYRRFFDVSDLIGVRVELPSVFEAVHQLVVRLAAEGKVTGLRVDHVDGLLDPEGYLRDLHAAVHSGQAGFYVVVEKILAGGERLPEAWECAGSTGYDFLGAVGHLLCDPAGARAVEEGWRRFTGVAMPFRAVSRACKRRVLRELFHGELTRLGQELARLARRDRHARHFSRRAWTAALAEVTVALPVYRTYVRDVEVPSADRAVLERAFADIASGETGLPPPVLGFLRRVLLLDFPSALPEEQHALWVRFVLRWQQLTGPVTAKGVEDTALFAYTPLLSLLEVGSGPEVPHDPAAALHALLEERQRAHPHGLNATSTHDTKRSEDVRARLHVLSELAVPWATARARWSRLARRHRRAVDGVVVPDPVEEDALYQTLLGVWPVDDPSPAALDALADRLGPVLVKSARERKVRTSWLHPVPEHEEALCAFARDLLGDRRVAAAIGELAGRVAWHGALNAVSQLVIKAAAPGVPDLYQGTETWSLRLLDPDNRVPVDHAALAAATAALDAELGDERAIEALWSRWQDGAIKLWITRKALALRRDRAELFRAGRYLPIVASGRRRGRVFAFARRLGRAWVLVAVPRLTVGLAPDGVLPLGRDAWGRGSLELPPEAPSRWRHVLTGEWIEGAALADLFARSPHALLEGVAGRGGARSGP